jgi:quinol monooxygenase YgiN
MSRNRRDFIFATSAALAGVAWTRMGIQNKSEKQMYGLIGKITTVSGQRDALIAILLEGIETMPGCLSYIVAKDPSDENAIWITEVWDSKTSHEASLKLPSVQRAISKGRPLIAGFGPSIVTEPVGGQGLPSPQR